MGEQKPLMVISDKEIAKIFIHPLRMKIIRSLIEPHTVKDLAMSLGVDQAKLYYHIGLLEKAGLIAVYGSRMVGNLEERSYRCLARDYAVDLQEGEALEPRDTLAQGIASIFPSAKAEMLASYRQLVAEKRAQVAAGMPPGETRTFTLRQTELKLSPERQKAFLEEVEGLVESYQADETGEGYSLLLAFYPAPKNRA
jgi:DNA-binding transcriptional ArsR family regulator